MVWDERLEEGREFQMIDAALRLAAITMRNILHLTISCDQY